MGIFLSWLVLSFVAAAFGADRKIGFWGALLLSLFLSPLIGFIGVALSERANATSGSTGNVLSAGQNYPLEIKERDTASQLKDLAELREKKVITDEEFNEQKARILK